MADAIKDVKNTKSWYDKVTQEEDYYSSLKYTKLESVSNEVLIKFLENPDLFLAIQKAYKEASGDSQLLSCSISKPISKTQASPSTPKPLLSLQN